METLHTIRKWLDKIVGTICIFLFALMVVVGSYQIITRFIFNNPSTISEELLTEKSVGNRAGSPCRCICSHRTDLWRI